MKYSDPQFGVRLQNVAYLDRPGAYALIRASDTRLAFVRGKARRLFLPGGGIRPGERPEEALLREIMEEICWSARILDMVGRATQLVFAEGEGYFAIRATYFRAALIERCTTQCEHEIVWLSAAAASTSLARESDAWAISRLGNSP
jgi:ADP-ribose pyrophosphatase YjhB (NUDIX family)